MASTVWKGHLTFGLVSVPVRLVRAARKERIPLHYARTSRPAATPSDESEQPAPQPVERIRQALVGTEDNTSVPRSELARAFEVRPESYVVIEQEELRQLRRKTSPDIAVQSFIRLEEIDPVYFETSYYVQPDSGGEKPYALLYLALKNTAHAALSTIAMHGREHILIVRSGPRGLIAHTMFYQDEVRMDLEFAADAAIAAPREIELATTLVTAMSEPFAPAEYQDAYREQLRALIASKEATAAPSKPEQPKKEPVDILEALKQSLAQAARKPPQKVTETARKARRKA